MRGSFMILDTNDQNLLAPNNRALCSNTWSFRHKAPNLLGRSCSHGGELPVNGNLSTPLTQRRRYTDAFLFPNTCEAGGTNGTQFLSPSRTIECACCSRADESRLEYVSKDYWQQKNFHQGISPAFAELRPLLWPAIVEPQQTSRFRPTRRPYDGPAMKPPQERRLLNTRSLKANSR